MSRVESVDADAFAETLARHLPRCYWSTAERRAAADVKSAGLAKTAVFAVAAVVVTVAAAGFSSLGAEVGLVCGLAAGALAAVAGYFVWVYRSVMRDRAHRRAVAALEAIVADRSGDLWLASTAGMPFEKRCEMFMLLTWFRHLAHFMPIPQYLAVRLGLSLADHPDDALWGHAGVYMRYKVDIGTNALRDRPRETFEAYKAAFFETALLLDALAALDEYRVNDETLELARRLTARGPDAVRAAAAMGDVPPQDRVAAACLLA